MNKTGKFLVISVGGLLALMITGMLVSVFIDVRPEEIKSRNLIDEWMWYRITFYLLVVVLWKLICTYLTRPRFDVKECAEKELAEFAKNREKDMKYLMKQWWKVALMFAFFEVVIIQQFGL